MSTRGDNDSSILSQESNSLLNNCSYLTESQILEQSSLSSEENSDNNNSYLTANNSSLNNGFPGGFSTLIEEYLRELHLAETSEIHLRKYKIFEECLEEMTKEPKWSQYAKLNDKMVSFSTFGNDATDLFDILRISSGGNFEPSNNLEFSREMNNRISEKCNEILRGKSTEKVRNESDAVNKSFVSLITDFIERSNEYGKSLKNYKDHLNRATNRLTEFYKIMTESCGKFQEMADNLGWKILSRSDKIDFLEDQQMDAALSSLSFALQETLADKKKELMELQNLEKLYEKVSRNSEYAQLVIAYAQQLTTLKIRLRLLQQLKEQKM